MPHFGQGTYQWIQNHYTLTKQIGTTPFTESSFGAQVFKLKSRHDDPFSRGPRRFGTDYAARIFDWIREEYLMAPQIGDRPVAGREFGVQIWNCFDNREN